MATFKIFRETALPGTLEPYSIYVIAPAGSPNYIELYVTNSLGTATRRIPTENDIQSLIDTSISNLSAIEVVDNITARDALSPTTNLHVYVIDASDDPTVTGGSASYVYQLSTNTWHKFSESESLDLDLTVNWVDIIDKPTSTVSQIDTTVANSHTHANKTELDKIGEDGSGYFTYNGALPVIAWNSTGW